MPLDFVEIKNIEYVHGDDIQEALSPSTAIYDLFLMKQYIRINSDVWYLM